MVSLPEARPPEADLLLEAVRAFGGTPEERERLTKLVALARNPGTVPTEAAAAAELAARLVRKYDPPPT
jgi:hypothetical protein